VTPLDSASFDDVAHAVASRYRARAPYYYVRTKLRIDPVARMLFRLGTAEHFGTIADVGCGRGQLGILFLLAELADGVLGVDWDEAKLEAATEAACDLPRARFEHGDVRTFPLSPVDTVLLVDVLHYMPHEDQDTLLVRACRAARRRIVIRDLDPSRGASSTLTRSWEWVTTTLGYNRGSTNVPARPLSAIREVLEREGLEVASEPCSAGLLSNGLLVARPSAVR
jgi:SAM-dependent methyltransferase